MGYTVQSTTADGDFEIIGGSAAVTIRHKPEAEARLQKHISPDSYLEPSVMYNNMVKDHKVVGLHPFWAIFSRTTPQELQAAINEEREKLVPVELLKSVCAVEEAQERGLEISNIVLLGSGSMHVGGCNVCCEHPPSEAVREITEALEMSVYFGLEGEPLPLVAQDPAYSKLEKKFMESIGITVVDDPDAFELIDEETLLIGHGVWWSVFYPVSKGPRPAAILSLDVPAKMGSRDSSKKSRKKTLEVRMQQKVLEMFEEYERDGFHDEEVEEMVREEHEKFGSKARKEMREGKMNAPCLFVRKEL